MMLHVLTAIAPCQSVRCMNSPDPVTLSVLDNRFRAIVDEMGEAMLRTAYSQILNSSRDFSIAICDARARLVAQAIPASSFLQGNFIFFNA